MGAAGQSTGYEIDQSIRFNDDDAAYLYRDNDAAQTDTKKFTYSLWIKRTAITGGTNTGLLSGGSGTTSGRTDFTFTAGATSGDGSNNDALKFDIYTGGWTQRRATAKIRDASAWYHIVLVYDAANSTANDTLIIYQNGTRLTLDSTSGVPNNLSLVNANSQRTKVGADASGTPVEFDGYMAEINMIDGQALAPTALGETNDDGVWIPKAYSGTYGDNGFYITGATDSDLGEDFSGNNNDFTSTGLATTDQMSDTPTKNFCTMNPLDAPTGSITLSNGNLDLNQSSFNKVRGTIAFDVQDDDGFYFEVKKTNGNFRSAGIVATDASNFASAQSLLSVNPSVVYYMEGGEVFQNGSQVLASLPTFATNDVLGVAVRNGKVYFAKNNTWVNSGDPVNETGQVASITGSSPLYSPAVGEQDNRSGITNTVNFGATAFAHTPPTGYKALNTANLATPTVADGSKYFQPALYTTQTTAQDITFSGNSDLAPDWLWFKRRDGASNHFLFDKVRGVLKTISSDDANPEVTSTGSMTAFGTDGFSLGDGGSDNDINGTSGATFVAWGWAAGNSAGSSNSDGSITSTVTANTTAGFSIVKYTGTKSNATIGHGLGVVPKMIIIKDTTNTESWIVYHEAVGNDGNLYLNLTNAKATQAVFQDTTPTSSVFSIGTTDGVNKASAVHIAYCFAEIPGYSSIGSYTGNGSTNGSFVYTGCKPAYVLLKRIDAAQEWQVYDTQRDPFNVADHRLVPNTSGAESILTGDNNLDFLSNGFKLRQANGGMNASGSPYIYMAFAENPFGGDGVAPATAR